MGRIHHQHVDTGLHQQLAALIVGLAHAHRGTHPQLAQLVLGGTRVLRRLGDVLDRDQSAQLEIAVDHHDPLEPMPVHQRFGLFQAGAFPHRDQLIALGHDLSHGRVQPRLEAQVAVGDDADHLRPFDHRQAGDAVLAR